jgi:hypothetical protein
MKSIFLQDGNSLIIKPDDLVRILEHLKQAFTGLDRITFYAQSHNIARISDDDLRRFAESGLNRIHIGMESGSDEVLKRVKKRHGHGNGIESTVKSDHVLNLFLPKGLPKLGIRAANIHPVGMTHCPDGWDDLDRVVLKLFSDQERKKRLRLSSVNSINWCRVMVQSVHCFYACFQVCALTGKKIGSSIVFSVHSGAFDNLFAGCLGRQMGLPAQTFICAVNANQTLFRAFTEGVFAPSALMPTCSSAIDIASPYYFWRFLYFASGRDWDKIKSWMADFDTDGRVELDAETRKCYQRTGRPSRSPTGREVVTAL